MDTTPHTHEELSQIADSCIHCGFCLPACPTYQLWGEEMDSPRGRIQLMKLGLEGEPLTATTAEHMDRCLGCMACVTACPSGVRYDVLITAKRAEVEQTHPRGWAQRWWRAMIFGLFPRPGRLRAARVPLRLAQWLRLDRLAARSRTLWRCFPGVSTMASLAPRLGPRRSMPRVVPAQGVKRATVGMLTGCVQREYFSEVNAATARVLAAEGCEVVIPQRQGCCGALSMHSGRAREAAKYARDTIAAFDGVDAIVVNSAGCGSAMKEYADALADDPQWSQKATDFANRVRDLSEYLAQLGPVAPRGELRVAVAYHDACHLSHAQQIRQQPRDLLDAVPGLRLREISDGGTCCGSAGVYNLLQPRAARELGDRKAARVAAAEADVLVSANPGCSMHIAAALRRDDRVMPVAHIAEVLDASISGRGAAELLER